jgi:hypothetical protein
MEDELSIGRPPLVINVMMGTRKEKLLEDLSEALPSQLLSITQVREWRILTNKVQKRRSCTHSLSRHQ